MVYKQYKISGRALSAKEVKVVDKIEEVMEQLREAIEMAEQGKCTDGNLAQLQRIEYELNEMCNKLNPKEYLPGYGHAIADSWDTDSILGNKLLEVLCHYKQL